MFRDDVLVWNMQAATFPSAAFLTQYGWGMLSDRIGRKVCSFYAPS